MIKHENVEKTHPCPICGLKFKIPAYVRAHISQCHKPESYIGNCEECGRGYKQAFQIRDCCHEIKIAKFRRNQQLNQQLGIQAGELFGEKAKESLGEKPIDSSAVPKNATVVYSKTPLLFQNIPSLETAGKSLGEKSIQAAKDDLTSNLDQIMQTQEGEQQTTIEEINAD